MTEQTEQTEQTEETEASEETTVASYAISRFPETLAVVRLGAGAEIPEWAESSSIFSITATATETSLICAGRSVPKKARHQKPFTAFSLDGGREIGATGVLVALLTPLAEADVSAFTISTFDTDWLLVPASQANRAEEAWRRSGHQVTPAAPAR